MIKIFKKLKRRNSNKNSRKNPYLESNVEKILSNLDSKNIINFEYLSEGSFGETYKFKLYENKVFNNIILRPETYIIKIFKRIPSFREITYLKKLSKYGLIPKIYYANEDFIIMKYINGLTIDKFIETENINFSILTKIDKLIRKWHELGFAHGDLSNSNILITEDYKVYFIDPYYTNSEEFEFDLDRLKYYWEKYL